MCPAKTTRNYDTLAGDFSLVSATMKEEGWDKSQTLLCPVFVEILSKRISHSRDSHQYCLEPLKFS